MLHVQSLEFVTAHLLCHGSRGFRFHQCRRVVARLKIEAEHLQHHLPRLDIFQSRSKFVAIGICLVSNLQGNCSVIARAKLVDQHQPSDAIFHAV